MDALFLCHRIPYPPDKGDKIRSWHMLRRLAERTRVHLGCLYDDPEDAVHLPELRRICADVAAFPRGRWRTRLRAAGGLLAGEPLSIACFRDPNLARWTEATCRRHKIPLRIAFSSAMAPYLDVAPRMMALSVVDFVDADAAKWAQYSHLRPWPFSSLCRREARLLWASDRRAAEAADACLFVSEPEAKIFRDALDAREPLPKILVAPNGVDLTRFNPWIAHPNPYPPGPPVVAFVGRMDYWANVDGAAWFAREVLPIVRSSAGDVRFFIVGSNPVATVRALEPRATVTGGVPDVRPYLQHADLVVVPLRVARGVQNKALEAMAMGRALLATASAYEGIEATPGSDLEIACGTEDFAAATIRLLADPAARRRLGEAARAAMVDRYDWPGRFATLDALIDAAAEVRALRVFAA